jgi:hypothetical protein
MGRSVAAVLTSEAVWQSISTDPMDRRFVDLLPSCEEMEKPRLKLLAILLPYPETVLPNVPVTVELLLVNVSVLGEL